MPFPTEALTGASSPIQQVRVAESVAGELRGRILRGEFSDGMLPKQEDLRREYSISHPSLREALRILETEGLVTVRRGNVGGAAVHRPGEGRFSYAMGLALQSKGTRTNELAKTLAWLEPQCARLCAANPDRATTVVPTLRKKVEAAEGIDGGVAFTHSSRDFHSAIVRLCGDSPFELIVGGLVRLWNAQEESWAATASSEGSYPSEVDRSHITKVHGKIVDLIDAGAADEVEIYMRKHIEAVQRLVLDRLDGRIVDASSPRSRRHLFTD